MKPVELKALIFHRRFICKKIATKSGITDANVYELQTTFVAYYDHCTAT